MKTTLFILLFILVSAQSAMSWPFDAKKTQETKITAAKEATPPVAQSNPLIENPDKNKAQMQTAAAVKNEIHGMPVIADLPKGFVPPEFPSTDNLARQELTIPVSPDNAAKSVQPINTKAIQDQIDEIIRMNETIKTRYASQANDIKRITEQARYHQKIIEDVQQSRTKDVVNDEKVRIIGNETAQNKKIIDELKSDQSAST